MQDNIIERLRRAVINDLFLTNTVNQCWGVWKPLIQNVIGPSPTPQSLLDIGEHLRDIFCQIVCSDKVRMIIKKML